MRGPAELRPPVLQEGGGEPCKLPAKGWCGYLRSRGWGPFEALVSEQTSILCVCSEPVLGNHSFSQRENSKTAAFSPQALAEFMNVTAMTTLSHTETPDDLADLVEYMYAEPSASHWGALRVADGHPLPYNTDQYFEIGNEIDTPDFGAKALAMEKAAVGTETRFWRHFTLKTILLPGQARDRHRKS
jgi:hypothetical protein